MWHNNGYYPTLGDNEELHELILDLNERPSDMNSSQYVISEVARKSNRLGKEKRRVKRVEYNTEVSFYTVWFICEIDMR